MNNKFIYESILCDENFLKYNDKNVLKPNKEELDFLETQINTYRERNDNDKIYVLPFFKLLMDNVRKIVPKKDDKALIIENIIEASRKNGNISLSKIEEEYQKVAKLKNIKPIKKSSIHSIIRNKLFYSFKKISVKTNKLIENNFIKKSYFFLKILLRGIRIGLDPVFIDECGFSLKNNNFRNWIKKNKEYSSKLSPEGNKINLIMAVTKNKILHFAVNKVTTDSNQFKIFIEELLNKMTEEEKKNNILIMDNLRAHLTVDLIQVYFNNNIKVLFNVPYKSSFNMIEKVFRYIKNITYKHIYDTKKLFLEDLNNIIKSDKLKSSLPKLYRETILIYKEFLISNLNINLNV